MGIVNIANSQIQVTQLNAAKDHSQKNLKLKKKKKKKKKKKTKTDLLTCYISGPKEMYHVTSEAAAACEGLPLLAPLRPPEALTEAFRLHARGVLHPHPAEGARAQRRLQQDDAACQLDGTVDG